MKKIFAPLVAVLAIACIATGLRAATSETTTDLAHVKVTAYQGTTPLLSMSGADCASVFYVLPPDVKTRIAGEWNKFAPTAPKHGSIAGVKYAFNNGDLTLQYKGYKIVATNVSFEMIGRILATAE